jgi:hypothetical protein
LTRDPERAAPQNEPETADRERVGSDRGGHPDPQRVGPRRQLRVVREARLGEGLGLVPARRREVDLRRRHVRGTRRSSSASTDRVVVASTARGCRCGSMTSTRSHAIFEREGLEVVEPPDDKPWGVRRCKFAIPTGTSSVLARRAPTSTRTSSRMDSCWDEVLGSTPEETLAVRRAAFRQLLSGRAASIEEVAAAAGLSRDAARQRPTSWSRSGWRRPTTG